MEEPSRRRGQRFALLGGLAAIVRLAAAYTYLVTPSLRPAAGSGASPAPRSRSLKVDQILAVSPRVVLLSITDYDFRPAGTRLLRSRDGGRTWSWITLPVPPAWLQLHLLQDGARLLEVYLPNAPPLYVSSDGGDSWAAVNLPPGQTIPGGAVFLDRRRGWYLSQAVEPTSAVQPVTLWSTSDGGDSWVQLLNVEVGSQDAGGMPLAGIKGSMLFSTPDRGWLLVRETTGRYLVMGTRDGGHSWEPASRLPLPDTGQPRPVGFTLSLSGSGRAGLVALATGPPFSITGCPAEPATLGFARVSDPDAAS